MFETEAAMRSLVEAKKDLEEEFLKEKVNLPILNEHLTRFTKQENDALRKEVQIVDKLIRDLSNRSVLIDDLNSEGTMMRTFLSSLLSFLPVNDLKLRLAKSTAAENVVDRTLVSSFIMSLLCVLEPAMTRDPEIVLAQRRAFCSLADILQWSVADISNVRVWRSMYK